MEILLVLRKDALAIFFIGLGILGCSENTERLQPVGNDLPSVTAQITHPQFKAEKVLSRKEYLDYIFQEFKKMGQSEFDPDLLKDDRIDYKKTYSNGTQFIGYKTVVEATRQKLTTIARGKLTSEKQSQIDLWLIVENSRKNGKDTGTKAIGNREKNFSAIQKAESKNMFTCTPSAENKASQDPTEILAFGTFVMHDGTEIKAVYKEETSDILSGNCGTESKIVPFKMKSINIYTADLKLLSDSSEAAGSVYELTQYENLQQEKQSWVAYEVLKAQKRPQK